MSLWGSFACEQKFSSPPVVDLCLGLNESFFNFTLESPCPVNRFRDTLRPITILSDSEEENIVTTPILNTDDDGSTGGDSSESESESENSPRTRRRRRMSLVMDDDFRDLSPGRVSCSPVQKRHKAKKRATGGRHKPQHFTFSRSDRKLSCQNLLGQVTHARARSRSVTMFPKSMTFPGVTAEFYPPNSA
jgi:hypothetical protein